MKYKINTYFKSLLADTLTPVNIYLKLRDVYAGTIMLESSDYHSHENSLSFICCEAFASFQVQKDEIEIRYPDKSRARITITDRSQVMKSLDDFRLQFDAPSVHKKYISCGLFGYISYDAVRFFEDINIDVKEDLIPDIVYKVYRYVIVVDHFSNELTFFENVIDPEAQPSTLEKLEKIVFSNRFPTFSFQPASEESSTVSDAEFVKMIEGGISHCQRGDVFQMVLSRRFTREFKGDEFNVYRALRSINPSPYLFYFDYGSYRIFGSSPEAQIRIKEGHASIYPIAGTFRRSGNDKEDLEIASRLVADEKENAEHVMLVDLARNDLSRDAVDVKVEVFKEIQYYSHVIHMVSKVTGKLRDPDSPLTLVADTFPAGTLSGAPKHSAMKLINKYENVNRGFYGGAIGAMGFDGDFNHAIMIRTFLSRDNKLICQAGAGIVSKSVPENELQEVNNKLEALKIAIKMAAEL